MLYPKDPKVRVEKHAKTLTIEWKWGSGSGYIFTIFSLIIFVFFWFVAHTPTVEYDHPPTSHVMGMLAFGWGCIALPSLLGGLTLLFNKTTIHADHDKIVRTVGPLPWKKPIVLRGPEISQFFVASPQDGVSARTLFVLDADQYQRKLASNFPSSFAAYQICHELQDWYGLPDLPVYGHTDLPQHPGPRKS